MAVTVKPLGRVGKYTKAGHKAHLKLAGGTPLANGGNMGSGSRRSSTRRSARRGGGY